MGGCEREEEAHGWPWRVFSIPDPPHPPMIGWRINGDDRRSRFHQGHLLNLLGGQRCPPQAPPRNQKCQEPAAKQTADGPPDAEKMEKMSETVSHCVIGARIKGPLALDYLPHWAVVAGIW